MENELGNSKENSETKTEQKTDTTAFEARIKALEAERDKLKQSVTNASADASEQKKRANKLEEELKAKMSDEERVKKEQEDANAALQKELEDLRTERNIAKYMAALGGSDIGMDTDTATAVAEALNSGDTDKVFDGIRKFIASHDKALAEKAMLNNPVLPGGNSTKTVSKEEFDKMGYREMVQFKADYPELYKEYMNKS